MGGDERTELDGMFAVPPPVASRLAELEAAVTDASLPLAERLCAEWLAKGYRLALEDMAAALQAGGFAQG